jgi:hypothetical protein
MVGGGKDTAMNYMSLMNLIRLERICYKVKQSLYTPWRRLGIEEV